MRAGGVMNMHQQEEARVYTRHLGKALVKVEFPSLEHFVQDVAGAGIDTVRMDTFKEARESELSFVHYVTLTLYVTAYDFSRKVLYEYEEPLGTRATADPTAIDPAFAEAAGARREQVERALSQAGLTVRHGRYLALVEP
jgi:hypothetical protein